MDSDTKEMYEEVLMLLECSTQNWLFGAGISCESNIPLMYRLTELVEEKIATSSYNSDFQAIKSQLNKDSHIEHYLSQISDIITLIERTSNTELTIGSANFSLKVLHELYGEIIKDIGEIIRYGYKIDATGHKTVGSINDPFVKIDNHISFVRALLGICKERTAHINFFTTNYDTLLEDALSIERQEVRDGFIGTAIGSWMPEKSFDFDHYKTNIYNVFKLHGSVDWYKDKSNNIMRCRYGTNYLSDNSNLLIYPQATKYIETQKDPFAYLSSSFRNCFKQSTDNVLITNGYSFGDNHINLEIENAIKQPSNKTSLIIFVKENKLPDDTYELSTILKRWIDDTTINQRIYILTNRGIYNGSKKIALDPLVPASDEYKWWTFNGMIQSVLLGGVVK